MTAKVILVTGASSGIGAACTALFRTGGATVVAASRSGERILDIRDPIAVESVLAGVVQEFGRLDAVVNAAGIAVGGPLEDTSIEALRAQMETNLMGAIYLSRAAAPYLRQFAPSSLVHISSIAAHIGLPYQSLYSASKAGMSALCEALRFELEPLGVHVMAIEPGSVRTAITGNRIKAEPGAVYRAASEKAMAVNDADELAGVDADRVAKAVQRALGRSGRLSVGKLEERVSIPLKRWLPSGLFRAIVGGHYR